MEGDGEKLCPRFCFFRTAGICAKQISQERITEIHDKETGIRNTRTGGII